MRGQPHRALYMIPRKYWISKLIMTSFIKKEKLHNIWKDSINRILKNEYKNYAKALKQIINKDK